MLPSASSPNPRFFATFRPSYRPIPRRLIVSFKVSRFHAHLLVATIPIIFSEVPANLPSPDQIVALCKKSGYKCDGIAFPDPSSSSGAVLAWFKYGPDVTMDETRTQAWVSEHLNANLPKAGVKVPRVYMAFTSPHPFCPIGYIVMEYIGAPDCRNRDYER